MEILCKLGAKIEVMSKESRIKTEISLMSLESIYNKILLLHKNRPKHIEKLQEVTVQPTDCPYSGSQFFCVDQNLDDYQMSQIRNVPFLFHESIE